MERDTEMRGQPADTIHCISYKRMERQKINSSNEIDRNHRILSVNQIIAIKVHRYKMTKILTSRAGEGRKLGRKDQKTGSRSDVPF